MRTTLREKLVLWLNGLAVFICLELLIRTHASPASLEGIALIAPTLIIMAVLTALLLRRP